LRQTRQRRTIVETIKLRRAEAHMPLYLGRFSYSTDAMHAMVSNPQDRSEAAREVVESLGGKLLGFWFALGDFDGAFLIEAPDNRSAAALAMAVGGAGAVADIETTVLLDMSEAQEAMRMAARATYRPPVRTGTANLEETGLSFGGP
jgi:uncharacterized protein with GYD domain